MISKRHSASPTRSTCCRRDRVRTSLGITSYRFRGRATRSTRACIPPLHRSTRGCGPISLAKWITGRRRHDVPRSPLCLDASAYSVGSPARDLGGGRPCRHTQSDACAQPEQDRSRPGRVILGWQHLEATVTAALGGLALGIAVGILLGVVAALVRFIAELLEPVMTVLNAIPRVILAPLFVIWLGIGSASKVALSFILVAVLIFFSFVYGIPGGDRIVF